MNRETKLALLLGFCAIVVVGVLVGEHFSKGRNDRPATTELGVSNAPAPTPAPTIAADPFNTNPGTPAMLPPGAGNAQNVRPLELTMDPAAAAQGAQPNLTAARTNRDTFLPPGGGSDAGMPILGSRTPGDDFIPNTEPVVTPYVPSTPVSAGIEKLYPVKRGETLPILAEKFYGNKSFAPQLATYNAKRLSPGGTVREGVTLHIPPKDVLLGKATLAGANTGATMPIDPVTKPTTTKAKTEAAKAEVIAAAPKPANKPGTYVIKKGDTLGHIAAATLGSSKKWEAILNANPNLDEDNLRVGQTIKIPAK